MNSETPKLSLFQAVRGRHGERLAQGVLRYLLTNDQAFRNSFCTWAGFPGDCTRIDEEQCSGDLRHDLVLHDWLVSINQKLRVKNMSLYQKYNP